MPIDAKVFEIVAQHGIGAILALVMFLIYRKDAAQHAKTIEAMKAQSDQQASDLRNQLAELKTVVKENTTAIAYNTDVSRAMVDAVNRIIPDPRRDHWKREGR